MKTNPGQLDHGVGWRAVLAVGLLLGLTWSARAEPATFLRAVTGTNGVVSLEVAARELLPARPRAPRIWLVGVVHIGEADYYQQLQTFLEEQTVVLFEGIGAADGDFDLQEEGFSLQDAMAEALGLEFQLKAIDYHRPHFRNSDLDYAELAGLFEGQPPAAGEATGAAAGSGGAEFGLLVQVMQGQGLLGGLAKLGVSAVAASPRLRASTRLMLIEMLGNLPANLSDAGGLPAGMQQLLEGLIEKRNEAVIGDVRGLLRQRPRPASIAVFYGAGHMGHLETRVCEALRYTPGEDRWFRALSVDPAKSGLSRFELAMTRAMVRLQLQALAPEEAPAASGEATVLADDEGVSAHRPDSDPD